MTKVREATPSNLNKRQVATLAESIARQVGYEPGCNLGTLIGNLGGRVEVRDTFADDPLQSGSLLVEREADFVIVVPPHTSPLRDNFTIAHELGHYIVHYLYKKRLVDGYSGKMIAYRKGSEKVEWQANWFAASFLMPEELFKKEFHRTKSASKAAEIFGVSTAAAQVRIKQLGID